MRGCGLRLGVRGKMADELCQRRAPARRESLFHSPVVVTEAGSHLRRIDSCITQLKAQGPSRTCNESKEEEEKEEDRAVNF